MSRPVCYGTPGLPDDADEKTWRCVCGHAWGPHEVGYYGMFMVDACHSCARAQEPTVLDRVIAEADEAARADEPKPVPVLPGQRGLFE